jgi:hypothetical protein
MRLVNYQALVHRKQGSVHRTIRGNRLIGLYALDALDIFLICLPVGLLITWRLLIGSVHQHRDERRANESFRGGEKYQRRLNIGLLHSQHEAMRLRICNSPCRAAMQLREHVFLAAAAPPLPLPDCDRRGDCLCEYSSHDDRRNGKERRYPAASIAAADSLVLPGSELLSSDNRKVADRRAKKTKAAAMGVYRKG